MIWFLINLFFQYNKYKWKYSFTINFKKQIGYFSQSKVASDIRDLVLFHGFVLGKNVNKIENIKVNGNKVKVSVSLLFDKSEKKLKDVVKIIKTALKKKEIQFNK